MHLFGLTGGIASGKSTVSARLRARGVPVIDADALAREVVEPGTEGLREVVAAFGREVLAGDALDRKKLGEIVFADASARARLNVITHGRIGQLTQARAAELTARGEPLACYEAALIVENGMADAFRPLVVVACPEDVQVTRLRARDALSDAQARERIRAQKPLAEKVALADFVVDASGSIEATLAGADRVLGDVCARTGVDRARYFSSDSP